MPKINNYWKAPVKKRHNKTYRKVLTKHNKRLRDKRILMYMLAWFVITATYAFIDISNDFVISCDEVVKATSIATPERVEVETPLLEQVLPVMIETKMYREFTAYNAGDPFQCDNTPCISASGDNICTLLAQGQIIFASNEFPIGTKLYVDGIGEGTVLDRMNSRFKTRIDVAMQAHEKPRAIAFGLQTLSVKIIK